MDGGRLRLLVEKEKAAPAHTVTLPATMDFDFGLMIPFTLLWFRGVPAELDVGLKSFPTSQFSG